MVKRRMADGETLILKPKDPASIIRLQDPAVIEQLLENPPAVLAELLAGWFATGNGFLATAGCRVAQSAFKGRVFEQFAREFNHLRQAGKLPDDFQEKKYGRKSWVELLTVLDEETPDEDRLEALKAMFYSVNEINATDGQKILGYQLFQIAKQLTSGQLLLLKSSYERLGSPTVREADKWVDLMSRRLGHNIREIVEQDERVLMEQRLLSPRNSIRHGDNIFGRKEKDEKEEENEEGVSDASGRLTPLGIRFCENIKNYALELVV
jgi:hypothetical protein